MNEKRLLLVVAIVACRAPLASAADIVVNPGESIQAAIESATDGDRVLVAPGTYPGAIDFLGRDVEVLASGGALSATIDASMAQVASAVTFQSGEPPTALLSGFAIVPSMSNLGASVRVVNSAATIAQCELATAPHVDAIYSQAAVVSVIDCSIGGDSGSGPTGQALNAANSDVTLQGVTTQHSITIDDGTSITTTNCQVGGLQGDDESGGHMASTVFTSGVHIESGSASSFTGCEFLASDTGLYFSGNGQTLVVDSCEFLANGGEYGGLASFGGPLELNNSVFEECAGESSGALYIYGSDAHVSATLFSNNEAEVFDATVVLWVGNLSLDGCSFVGNRGSAAVSTDSPVFSGTLTISDSLFEGNEGGGVVCLAPDAFITDSTFSGNGGNSKPSLRFEGSSVGSPPAIVRACRFIGNALATEHTQVNVEYEQCVFDGNGPSFFTGAAATVANTTGAGTAGCNGTITMRDCLLIRNFSPGSGSRVLYRSLNAPCFLVSRCTFATNSGVEVLNQGDVKDSIFWGNDGPPVNATITYSNVQGGHPGEGNIDSNPLFLDPLHGGYGLQSESPCIDAGDPSSPLDGDGTPADMGIATEFVYPDCNENAIADYIEAPGNDCNNNGILDQCETDDCNSNSVPDSCEIASGTSADCNANAVPDECEPDCNGNGIPDDCDIVSGYSLDLDGDGVPDECRADCNGNGLPDFVELAFGTVPDCNENDVPDDCDITGGASVDCNDNSVPDECEIASGDEADCDSDGVPDSCQLVTDDCNGNGIPDPCDIAAGTSLDLNGDGHPDECKPDCNDNGIPDYLDIQFGLSLDLSDDGVPDECQLLSADTSLISLAIGGSQAFSLHAGPGHGGATYLLLGSASGTSPGVLLGSAPTPLNIDFYFLFTLASVNQAPLESSFGVLDESGQAAASITVPPGLDPSLAGLELHHAYVLTDEGGTSLVEASNPIGLTLGM